MASYISRHVHQDKDVKVHGHIIGKSKSQSNDEDWEAIDSQIKFWFYSTCDAILP